MFYIKNKDVLLAEFGMDRFGDISLMKDYGLPVFIRNRFDAWVRSRGFYKHRAHLQETLDHFKLTSLTDVLKFSRGLSLNDTLWIVQDKDDRWEDYNPYTHEFNPLIEQLMWSGGIVLDTLSPTYFSSAELSNDGALPKCWHRDDNGRINLYKASRYKEGKKANEPLSEVLCSQVLDSLGFCHTRYGLSYFKGRWASRCELFTSEDVMFVKASHMFGEDVNTIFILDKLAEFGFMPQIRELILFDALVYNTDRHRSNYGLLLDASSLEVIGFAPIYDNGFGFFPYWTPDQCSVDTFAKRCPCKMFDTFELGVEWLRSKGQVIDDIEGLLTFRFNRAAIQVYDQKRITEIERWLNRHTLALLQGNNSESRRVLKVQNTLNEKPDG